MLIEKSNFVDNIYAKYTVIVEIVSTVLCLNAHKYVENSLMNKKKGKCLHK